jgi:CPA1 family monovalent cation:H+ antiporter
MGVRAKITVMDELWPVIGLVVGVLLVTSAAQRAHASPPIVLLVVGFAVSFIPGVPEYAVDPDLVLFVIIPPLLYAAAVDSGVIAIKTMIRPIGQLAFGMVLVSAFAVGFELHAVVPGIPFAAALALGAIVAPPDAVASVAVGRRVGLPRRVMTVLEGESLFNDATSLTTLRVALLALAAGSFPWGHAVLAFGWALIGGVLAGLGVGIAVSFLRRMIEAPLPVTGLSLVAPYVAYLLGDEIRASGVLAVVVAGLLLGFRAPTEVAARVRLTESATWDTLRFVLEGIVFALIGLELWAIVTTVSTGVGTAVVAVVAVFLTVLLIRPVWVFAFSYLTSIGRERQPERVKQLAIVSWAGMRGVVSLVAAQTLPLSTPYRSLLLLCTVVVIVGTLVLQGLSLPWFIRKLKLEGDPRAEEDAEREAARAEASQAIRDRVDELVAEKGIPPQYATMMHRWASLRDWQSMGSGSDPRFDLRRAKMQNWQRQIVQIERGVFVQMRDSGRLSEDVLRSLQNDLDLEEALLEARSMGASDESEDAHLEAAAVGSAARFGGDHSDAYSPEQAVRLTAGGRGADGRFDAGRAGFRGAMPGSGVPPEATGLGWARLDAPDNGGHTQSGDPREGQLP